MDVMKTTRALTCLKSLVLQGLEPLFDVLGRPVSSGFDFSSSTTRHRIDVRPSIEVLLLDEPLLDERIQVWIEPPVTDLCLVVVLQLVFDGEPVWLFKPGCHPEQVALECCEIMHSDARACQGVNVRGATTSKCTDPLVHES